MIYCNDYGDEPACLGEADARYTMDYRDVPDGGLIHWCAFCGPRAHGMKALIERALDDDPGFAAEFGQAIENAETKQRSAAS